MRKLLIGIVILVPVAIGGYFGAAYLAHRWFENEIEAQFAALRAAGADASRGPVSVDLLRRTLEVADISIAQQGAFPFTAKIGRVTARGVGLPMAGRLSADRIEVVDVEVERKSPTLRAGGATYQIPRIELIGYSGPAVPIAVSSGASALDQLRASLQQLAAVNIASAAIPTMTASVQPAVVGNGPQFAGPVTVTYSGVTLQGLRDGRVAGAAIDQSDIQFPRILGLGASDQFALQIARMSMSDMDFGGMLAALDPQAAKDDSFRRAYGRVTAGPLTFALTNGWHAALDGFSVDDVQFNPSRMHLGEFLASVEAMQAAPVAPSPAQLGELVNGAAAFYDGMRVGKVEALGLSVTGPPDGDIKLATFRLAGLDNGRFAEIAVEGLDTQTPQGSVKVGRFAVLGFQIANAIRLAAQAGTPNAKSPAEQAVDALRLIDGFESRQLNLPDGAGNRYVVDAFSIGWGKFVGPIPTQARVTLAMTAPIDKNNPQLEAAVAAGITSAKLAYDMEAAWAEAGKTFSIMPLVLDIENMFHASAALSVGNVPRDIFSIDPAAFTAFSMGVEAGPIEFTLQDAGGLELAVSMFAQQQGLSATDARKAIIATANELAGQLVAQNGELKPVADAVVAFLGAPKGKLSIKLVPKTRTPVMALVAEGQVDPSAVMSRFNITAAATR
jgi:hypothetical protein